MGEKNKVRREKGKVPQDQREPRGKADGLEYFRSIPEEI